MTPSSAETVGKNLEAIQAAIVKHNGNCPGEIVEVLMNPFELERLGWDDFRGIPISPDSNIGTGRFHLVCDVEHDHDRALEEEADTERELVTVGGGGAYDDLERRTV